MTSMRKSFQNLMIILATQVLLCSCIREKVKNPTIIAVPCEVKDTLTYQGQIAPILSQNCFPCHVYPGSGGINMDNFTDVKAVALSGMLVQSIIHDTTYVIMPPPPQKLLDSCDIKRIKRWIQTGCREY
jgi:hypothetical protein